MPEIVAETPLSEVLHVPGTANATLLVFGRAGEPGWAGMAAAQGLGFEVLLLRPRLDDDFPDDEMQALLPAIAARRTAKRPLIALGGEAAVRHAALAGASLVLGFGAGEVATPGRGCDVFLFVDPQGTLPSAAGVQVVTVPGLADAPDMLVAGEDRLGQLLTLARKRGAVAGRAKALRDWAASLDAPAEGGLLALVALLVSQGEIAAARVVVGEAGGELVLPEALAEALRSRAAPRRGVTLPDMAQAEALVAEDPVQALRLAQAAARPRTGDPAAMVALSRVLRQAGALDAAVAALRAASFGPAETVLAAVYQGPGKAKP